MQTPNLSIVAPVFNEVQVIREVVEGWINLLNVPQNSYEIILSNDGSTDGTDAVLRELEYKYPQLKVFHSGKNEGYGSALSKAIAQSQGKWVLTIDSDGQFDLNDYFRLETATTKDKADCAVGIRKKKDSLIRVIADKTLRLICFLIFGKAYRDPNCALKLCSGNLLRSLSLESRGFSSPSEILYTLDALNARISEVPVTHLERKAGISKLNVFETGLKMLLFLVHLKLRIFLSKRGILYLIHPTRNRSHSEPMNPSPSKELPCT